MIDKLNVGWRNVLKLEQYDQMKRAWSRFAQRKTQTMGMYRKDRKRPG